jgi:hypothetical protein
MSKFHVSLQAVCARMKRNGGKSNVKEIWIDTRSGCARGFYDRLVQAEE